LFFSLGNRNKSIQVRPSGKIGSGTTEVVYLKREELYFKKCYYFETML
jgi:hypothetical protein